MLYDFILNKLNNFIHRETVEVGLHYKQLHKQYKSKQKQYLYGHSWSTTVLKCVACKFKLRWH